MENQLKSHSVIVITDSPGNYFGYTSNIDEFQTKSESRETSLFSSLRPFLIFGRIIGLVPLNGVFSKNSDGPSFRKTSFPAILNLLVALMCVVNSGVTLVGIVTGPVSSVNDYCWTITTFVFYATSIYTSWHFYQRSPDLIQIFHKWEQLEIYFSAPDSNLSFDVNLVAGIVMVSAILENAVGHLNLFPVVEAADQATTSAGAWETYYVRSHKLWANVIPFNLPAALFVFVSNKFALYSWNFMDLIIVIFARALYFKFKALLQKVEISLVTPKNSLDVNLWRQITKDHQNLCCMLKVVNQFLSPLIFLSYGKNIYFICIQLHLGLTPNSKTSAIATIYAFWSFVHLIGRVYLINEAGARLHLWAHKVTDLFRRCPNEAYITEVKRSERYLSSHIISLTGSGCFNITKPLILRVVGIVCTFEVVLLQASQTPSAQNK